MSRVATAVTLRERPSLALPEELKREARWEQRSEVANITRGMFRADPSEGKSITDSGIDAEVKCDRGGVAGSFDKIPHTARPIAVGVAEMANLNSKEILKLFLRGEDFFFGIFICAKSSSPLPLKLTAPAFTGVASARAFGKVKNSLKF